MRALADKVAVITGAASGIGRGVSQRFAAEGAVVYALDRNASGLANLSCAKGIEVDITDEGSVVRAFEHVLEEDGRVDAVLANAGVQLFGRDAPVADLETDAWHHTIEVNLTGTFFTIKHAVRAMATTGGSIIVTGSPTGLTGIGNTFTAYSSSKAGVHGLTRVVAADYAKFGIRVNTVVPGFTKTPLVTEITDSPEKTADLVRQVPLGRASTVRDVAGIMVYLASDESAYATGGTFIVDGGLTL